MTALQEVRFPEIVGYRHDVILKNLGIRLRSLRNHHMFYKKTVAMRVDISPTQYRRLEEGKAVPRLDTLLHLANLYKVPVEFLVFNSAAPFNPLDAMTQFGSGRSWS